jgi:hypothetical protein
MEQRVYHLGSDGFEWSMSEVLANGIRLCQCRLSCRNEVSHHVPTCVGGHARML